MNEGAADRKEPAPPPARPQRAGAEADEDGAPVASSQASEPPASVRETMQRTRRYRPGPSPPARRRRPSRPRGPTPPPARELTDVPETEIPSREVEVGNDVWNVLVKGSSRVGSADAHGVRLLSVRLETPGDRPNPEGTHYLVAERLDDVDEDVLRGLVARAVGRSAKASESARPARKRRGRGRFRHRNR